MIIEHNNSIKEEQHIITDIFATTQKNINIDNNDELALIVDEIFES